MWRTSRALETQIEAYGEPSNSGSLSAIHCSLAASAASRSPVATRSSSSPRVTATPSRAGGTATSGSRPSRTAIAAAGSTHESTTPSRSSAAERDPLGPARRPRRRAARWPQRRVGDVAPRGARGVGERDVRVRVRALGASDVADIGVVDADAPARIIERNTAAKAGRAAQGAYPLQPTPSGGTRITCEYRWIVTPVLDRLTASLARA